MAILENIRLALTSLHSNRMRSILTMLGIIIGIGSVIAIVTIGDSITGSINDEFASFGARNVTVQVQQKDDPAQYVTADGSYDWSGYEPKTPTSADYISESMLGDYRRRFGDVLDMLAVGENVGSAKLTNGRNKAAVAAVGCSPDRQRLDELKLLAGRFLRQSDIDKKRAVALVSDEFVRRYFGGGTTPDQALGRSVKLDLSGRQMRLYILGIYQYKKADGVTAVTADTETNLYLPYSTAKQQLQLASGYSSVTVRCRKDADAAVFLKNTNAFFSSYYTRDKNFTARATSMESMVKSMNKSLNTVKLGISAVAAISLLVGGIGVMNIMMVSVTERTREIGIRMALGARTRAILFQFIVEAVIICLIGGLIGVGLGVTLGSIGARLMHYAARPSAAAIFVAVTFSMAIGVFFGYYPARKASRLDPIEALRYE